MWLIQVVVLGPCMTLVKNTPHNKQAKTCRPFVFQKVTSISSHLSETTQVAGSVCCHQLGSLFPGAKKKAIIMLQCTCALVRILFMMSCVMYNYYMMHFSCKYCSPIIERCQSLFFTIKIEASYYCIIVQCCIA